MPLLKGDRGWFRLFREDAISRHITSISAFLQELLKPEPIDTHLPNSQRSAAWLNARRNLGLDRQACQLNWMPDS
jgi:hypothetical protein